MAGQFFTGVFDYTRDGDSAVIPAAFKVLSNDPANAPAPITDAYAGCIGNTRPPGCRSCGNQNTRHFVWIGSDGTDTAVNTHKVPVSSTGTVLLDCYNALAGSGVNACVNYKGESTRMINRSLGL